MNSMVPLVFPLVRDLSTKNGKFVAFISKMLYHRNNRFMQKKAWLSARGDG